jgi:hypothetical protein
MIHSLFITANWKGVGKSKKYFSLGDICTCASPWSSRPGQRDSKGSWTLLLQVQGWRESRTEAPPVHDGHFRQVVVARGLMLLETCTAAHPGKWISLSLKFLLSEGHQDPGMHRAVSQPFSASSWLRNVTLLPLCYAADYRLDDSSRHIFAIRASASPLPARPYIPLFHQLERASKKQKLA